MKAQVVRIGNSRGIRIPKLLLTQTGLQGEVDISARTGCLVIRRVAGPRAGWADCFKAMARRGDDALLEASAPLPTTWDEEDWEWK